MVVECGICDAEDRLAYDAGMIHAVCRGQDVVADVIGKSNFLLPKGIVLGVIVQKQKPQRIIQNRRGIAVCIAFLQQHVIGFKFRNDVRSVCNKRAEVGVFLLHCFVALCKILTQRIEGLMDE